MRVIIFMLLIVSKSFIVNCSILDYMSGKFKEITGYISTTFSGVSDKVMSYFEETKAEKNTEEEGNKADGSITREMKFTFNVIESKERVYNINEKVDTEHFVTTPQLAHWHGRDMESHVIQTADYYFLTVHRITSNPYLQGNRTVLLHHGILGSSTDWILLGPTKSLPYILSDAGFDVWITNARGNYYSRGHTSKHVKCADYWKFSWQEIGELDLPAVISYIRHTKNFTESINFIGHSMGATALLVLLSSMPKYNEYLRIGILLAPLAYMNNVFGPLTAMKLTSEETAKLFETGELLPSRKVPSWLAAKYCEGSWIMCNNPLFFFTGFHQDEKWDASFIAKLLYYVPAGGSTRTLLHYMQVANNGKFHRFNKPDDVFPLKNVTLPIALISSNDDWLATVPNVLQLFISLSNPVDHYVIKNRNMVHTDFVWGIDANVFVYEKILEYLERGSQWNLERQNEV